MAVGTQIYFLGDWPGDPSVGLHVVDGCSTVSVPITSYNWDYGDNSTDSGASVSHTYATKGQYVSTYIVSLTATDSYDPVSDPAQLGVRVFESAPAAPVVVQPTVGEMICGLTPLITWTEQLHSQYQVRVQPANNLDDTPVWDSGQVTSDGSQVTCGVELTESTPYYVFVRESNPIDWGPWSSGQLFTVMTPAPPTCVSVSPSSGTFATNTVQTFTACYSDDCTSSNIDLTELLIDSSTLDGVSACHLKYDCNLNQCWLADDNGNTWTGGDGYSPGSQNVLENSQVIVNLADTTVSGTGNNLCVTWSLEFKNAFTGVKTLALSATNNSGFASGSGWSAFGNITIAVDSGPSSIITAPTNGQIVNTMPFAISGTASDNVYEIQKVEVSTDGGNTWANASGGSSWTTVGLALKMASITYGHALPAMVTWRCRVRASK